MFRLPVVSFWLVGVSLIVGSKSSIKAQALYTLTDLGTLGGPSSAANGINDSGQIVGDSYTSSGTEQGFFYSNGGMTDVGTLGGVTSAANGINDSGEVVGYSNTTSGGTHAFSYSNGNMTDLGTLGGTTSVANGINNAGQITGYSDTSANDPLAFIYSDQNMVSIGEIDLGGSVGFAINDSGQVAGDLLFVSSFGEGVSEGNQALSSDGVTPAARLPGNGLRAFFYSNDKMEDLYTIAEVGPVRHAYGINNAGQVVGTAPNGAFLYNSSTETATYLGTLGGTTSVANGINNSGQIVGYSNTISGSTDAFVYSKSGGMSDLNNLIPANSGWTITSANAINSSGQIAANATNASGQSHAVLLTPIASGPDQIVFYDEPPSASNVSTVFGHVFVQLIPNDAPAVGTFYRGFVPAEVDIFGGPGKVQDQSATPWDYKITYTVSDSAYEQVVQLINSDESSPHTYSLFSYNCVSWMNSIANTAGITLPNDFINETPDPAGFRESLAVLGNGHMYDGGTVTANQSAASSIKSAASVNVSAVSPFDYSYSAVVNEGHSNPGALASQLGLPLDSVNMGAANSNQLNGLVIDVENEDPNTVLISMNWGDGSLFENQTDDLSHVYTSGTYTADLLIVDSGAVHSYDFEIATSAMSGDDLSITPTIYPPSQEANPGLVDATPIPDVVNVPEPTSLGVTTGLFAVSMISRGRSRRNRRHDSGHA